MAKAYACDRCGKLFKQSEYSQEVPVVLESDREFYVDLGNSQTYISLCPKCRAGFQKWWDEGAARKTTDGVHRCNIYEVPEEDEYEDEIIYNGRRYVSADHIVEARPKENKDE